MPLEDGSRRVQEGEGVGRPPPCRPANLTRNLAWAHPVRPVSTRQRHRPLSVERHCFFPAQSGGAIKEGMDPCPTAPPEAWAPVATRAAANRKPQPGPSRCAICSSSMDRHLSAIGPRGPLNMQSAITTEQGRLAYTWTRGRRVQTGQEFECRPLGLAVVELLQAKRHPLQGPSTATDPNPRQWSSKIAAPLGPRREHKPV